MKSISLFVLLLFIFSACSTQRIGVESSVMELSLAEVVDSSQYISKISIDITQLPVAPEANWGRKYTCPIGISKDELIKAESLSIALVPVYSSDAVGKPQERKLRKGEAKSFFLLGLLGFIPITVGVPSVLAVILSWNALKRRKFNNKNEEKFSRAGFILGVVALAFWIPIGLAVLIASILSIWL